MIAGLDAWMLQRRRIRWQRRVSPGPLSQLWASSPTTIGDRLLAVDLEATGLDARRDSIVSLGWVAVDGARVVVGSARHVVVRTERAMNQSATIHGLLDVDVQRGQPLQQAMVQLFDALAGRALIVHGAQLDIGLLSHACRELFGAPLLMPYVDTLVLGQRKLSRGGELALRHGALRLAALRQHYGLPALASHNALVDALATAELYLALRQR